MPALSPIISIFSSFYIIASDWRARLMQQAGRMSSLCLHGIATLGLLNANTERSFLMLYWYSVILWLWLTLASLISCLNFYMSQDYVEAGDFAWLMFLVLNEDSGICH